MKTSRNLVKLAIMCVGVQDMSAGAVTPALASIMKAFPTVNPSTIMMMATIPSLCIVVFSPVYAKLQEFLNKRTILLISAFCIIVGGSSGAFLSNVYLILITRVIQGAGVAFCLPMGYDLVCDFFEGQEKQTMLGWVSAVSSLGGMLLQLLGGLLAAISWRYCFFAYLTGIIFFSISLSLLPEPEKKIIPCDCETGKVKFSMPFIGWAYCILHTIFFVCIFGLMTNAAVVIVGENLSNPAGAGLALSLVSFGSLLASFVFGRVFKIFKYSALPISFLIGAVAFGIGYLSHNINLMYLTGLLAGMAMGLDITTVISRVNSVAMGAMAIAMPLSLGSIGAFVQPWVYQVIFSITHTNPGRSAFLISAIGSILVLLLALVVNQWASSKQKLAAKELATII